MFRKFREKIERALERKEAERPLTRDELQRVLSGMRDELIEMRARIPKLEKEAEGLAVRAKQLVKRAELAHTKAQECQGAGDTDGAQTNLDAARGALSDAEALRTQEAEITDELERMRVEYEDKLEQLKDAERGKSAILARSRRVRTAQKLDEALRGPEGGIRRFEQAEDDIQTAEDLAEAEREVADALGERPSMRQLETDYELRKLEAAKEADEVERKLLELKRQMEEEEG
jgi:phage shock protein A